MGFGFTGGASLTAGVTATNAAGLSALEGRSRQGGVAAGLPFGPGGEVNVVSGIGYQGVDVGFGFGAGLPVSPQIFFNNTLLSVYYDTPSPISRR
jgi:hypothetical protein